MSMTTTWDREEALRVAERLEHPHWGMVEEAALLRAADAEITRLRAREADAERAVETAREAVEMFEWCQADEYDRGWRPASDAISDLRAALAAWDASREGGQ